MRYIILFIEFNKSDIVEKSSTTDLWLKENLWDPAFKLRKYHRLA